MKKSKVWAVLGASEGLGPATIKYLLSRDQPVIALAHGNPAGLCDALNAFTSRHGLIDILIDNLAYGLIDGLEKTTAAHVEAQIEKNLLETLYTIKLVLPYMASCPEGQIIGMPPKPCVLMDSGEPVYDERADAVERYCTQLQKKLLTLDDKITYLAPKGNRSLWRK
jgi:NADP-dependent 3-hydroxy acid dehydrogenase YdfG